MRTTITIDDSFEEKLRQLASKRQISDFVNQCLREHFEKEEKARKIKGLEKAYLRASKESRISQDFHPLDIEGWPEW